MEVSEMLETLVGELTAQQFIALLCSFVLTIVLIFMIAAAIGELVAYSIKGLVYIFRKDKYKSRDLTIIRASKHVAALRRQFKSAKTQTEYYLFLNRLSSTILAYEEIGLFPPEYYLKMIRVSSIYDKKLKERWEKEKIENQERK